MRCHERTHAGHSRREKKREGKEEAMWGEGMNRKEKTKGKGKRKDRKKETDYLFLEFVIRKLYCPYYYWVMKIEGCSYIN
jgi:hypothetical protein